MMLIMFNFMIYKANDWPQVFDDSLARKDWGWSHDYGIDELCEVSSNYSETYNFSYLILVHILQYLLRI